MPATSDHLEHLDAWWSTREIDGEHDDADPVVQSQADAGAFEAATLRRSEMLLRSGIALGALDFGEDPGVVGPIEAEDVDLDARHASIAGDDLNAPPGEFLRREVFAVPSDRAGIEVSAARPGGDARRFSLEAAKGSDEVARGDLQADPDRSDSSCEEVRRVVSGPPHSAVSGVSIVRAASMDR